MSNYEFDGFVSIELTEEVLRKLEYAEMVAERLSALAKHPAYTHESLGLSGAIREHVDVLRGKIKKRQFTSFGTIQFLDEQVSWGEASLQRAAREVGWR